MGERSIRIVSTPPGDAPQWVREEWVGLELPIVGTRSRRSLSFSVNVKPRLLHVVWAALSGKAEIMTGYQVEARRAVDILAAKSSEAADWWRQNTPELLRPGCPFGFHAEACQLVEA
ncbi:MAG: hypothetical protein AB7P12_18900 [Alphaproteobacteria bacterium]